MFDILDNSVDELQRVSKGEECIELGLLRTLGVEYIPQLLKQFQESELGKNITFHFHDGMTPDLIDMLKNKTCDLVFCSYAENEPSIKFVPVYDHNLFVIVPSDHVLATKDEISLEETLKYPYIYFHKRTGVRRVIDQLFQEIGKRPNISIEIGEDQVIAGFVAKGFGIAIVPDMEILDLLPIKKIKIKGVSRKQTYCLAYLKDKQYSKAINQFIKFIQNT